ncbi:hypothetical protein BXZ70DRAFT_60781 [Cristinia sonorae]|uniref:Uncharacterized protein n=1 Tax=Cristinia sonorae TaxID=1940300 RepID=A0A8K0USC2_9AGAR|nr:hypothetical protein BXZ70DRAFT_60781 [Cristinia sonorae]
MLPSISRRACPGRLIIPRTIHFSVIRTFIICSKFPRHYPSYPHPRAPHIPIPRIKRPFTTAARPHETQRTESFPDPDRPDLFYHLFHPPTALSSSAPVYALSFLQDAPRNVTSKTILGWLPAAGQGADGAGLNDFKENPAFRVLLHEALQSALKDNVDEVQRNGAIQTQQGWMHINDERNVPALGRIGDPDDILASVRVEEGKILAETYQPMPSYRLCTADGILQLSEGLARRLKERLAEEARIENKHTG